MKLIAAVSLDWGIGKDNRLLFDIPCDMRFFREKTSGKTVILGRKNLESFPGGKPLKNRTNIVLTKDERFEAEGAVVLRSVDEVLDFCKDKNDVFVIGGESIYRQFEKYCDTAYITKVFESVPCDKYMPNLDESPDWAVSEKSEKIEDNGHLISFLTYKRK